MDIPIRNRRVEDVEESDAKLLDDRERTHGIWAQTAIVTWEIWEALSNGRNWEELPPHAKVALFLMSNKMARIVVGRWEVSDHWVDLGGYSELEQKELAELELDDLDIAI